MTIRKKVLTLTLLYLTVLLNACSLPRKVSEKIQTALYPDVETREFIDSYEKNLNKEYELRSDRREDLYARRILNRMNSIYSKSSRLTSKEQEIVEDYLTDISEDAAKDSAKQKFKTENLEKKFKFKFEMSKAKREPGVYNLFGALKETKFRARPSTRGLVKAYAKTDNIKVGWMKFDEARIETEGLNRYGFRLRRQINKNIVQDAGYNNYYGSYIMLSFIKTF